jgi:CIC family chloride channel protein
MTVSRLFPFSWFNLQLLRRGVDVRSGREVRIMRERRIRELVTEDVAVIGPAATVGEARDRLLELDATEMLVVDDDGTLIGQVSLAALVRAAADSQTTAMRDLAATPGIVLQSDDSLDQAMKQLRYFVGVSVPVVDTTATMQLSGVVYQSSVIGAYNDAVEQARAEERGSD